MIDEPKVIYAPTMKTPIYSWCCCQRHHRVTRCLSYIIKQMLLGLLILSAAAPNTYAETISVPSKIKFVNMRLHISHSAKKEIEKKVKSLTCSPKHFAILLERVNLYMPIIEKILKEEGMHEDFKYLVIQESTLISDHVSESNAVGFWQFKREAATEVGMQIDGHIDERMHIVESTRGFVKYVKKHYSHFNNWLYSLLAFYLGRGGMNLYIKEKNWHIKHSKAAIDERAHWYIYHFIAHKLVFEKAIGKKKHSELKLYEYKASSGTKLSEISQQFEVPLQNLQDYNKWLKTTRIPKDTRCAVFVPLKHAQYKRIEKKKPSAKPHHPKEVLDYSSYYQQAEQYPTIMVDALLTSAAQDRPLLQEESLIINGIPGARAAADDSLDSLAQRGNISLEQLLVYNDITIVHQVEVGQVYYFESKHDKGPIHYHITRPADTLWSIAQKYGMKLSALLQKNRMQQVTDLQLGQVVWLRFIRPARVPIEYVQTPPIAPHITSVDFEGEEEVDRYQI